MSANSSIQKIAIEVDTSTIAISNSGSITGVIAIRVGDAIFPEARWDDFPVRILSWWFQPVSRILAGKSHVWECLFMDGPYTLRLEHVQNDTWTVRGFYDRRTVEFTATVSCRAFLDNLLGVSRGILRDCRQRGWQSDDIDALDKAVRNAQREMA